MGGQVQRRAGSLKSRRWRNNTTSHRNEKTSGSGKSLVFWLLYGGMAYSPSVRLSIQSWSSRMRCLRASRSASTLRRVSDFW